MKKHVKLIALIFIVAIVASMLAFPTQAATADYTRPGATSSSKLTAADILKLTMGLELGEAEKNYLELHGNYEILYPSHIPTSYVTVGYSSDTELLVIEAAKYSYTANNGTVVLWTPKSVLVDGEEKTFAVEGDKYKAVFESVEDGSDAVARVEYSTQFKVTQTAINRIINQAFNDAEEWKTTIAQKTAEYERLSALFEKNSEDYGKYLDELEEYKAELALYEAYLVEKRKYDDALEEYNDYLDKLEEFERLSDLYDEYEKKLEQFAIDYALYEKYLKDEEEYPDKLAAYNLYVEKCNKIKEQLTFMDGMKRYVTSYKRSLYSAIIGDTVTKVLQNKDTLTSAVIGVDSAVIEKAENATVKIREIYAAYFALAEEKDKYGYYFTHYDDIRDNFIALFQALDKMYQNPKVRTAIIEYGPDMQEKFEILLAQLYYTVNALSDFTVPRYDGGVFDSTYAVNPLTERKPLTLLGGKPYMADTDSATPLEGGYPVTVKEPEPVVSVEEPEAVEYMAEPVCPDEVDDPGDAPEEITEPQKPQEIAHPGNAPVPYSPPEAVPELVSAYDRGELTLRSKADSSKTFSVSLEVEKSIFNQETCIVEFCDTDGNLLERVVVDKNSFAEYTGEIPEREEDAAATYTFAGWADENGKPVDLTSVKESIKVYPYFTPNYKSYVVSWNVNGTVTTETLVYGTVPQYDGVPTRPADRNVEYEFSGWDKPIVALVENTTYTAIFTPLVELPNGSGAEITRNEKGDYTVELGGNSSDGVSFSGLIERASSKGALTVKSDDFSAYFAFAEVIAMQEAGVDRIALDLTKAGDDSYTLKLNVLTADGEEIGTRIRSSVTVACSFSDATKVKVYSLDSNGERVNASYTLGENTITVVQNSGTEYYALTEYEYAIILLPNDTVTVSLSSNKALAGEWVTVTLEVPDGVTLEGVYYTVGSDEEKVYFTEEGFYMPHGNVRVGVEFHENVYVVQFLSDGKVISSEEYLYGEIPTPPASPVKMSDGKYTYTFSGWSAEVCAVTEDATYEAVYTAEPIPEKEEHDGFYATPGVWKIIIAIGVAAVYLLLVFLPCVVIVVVKLLLYKSRKYKQNKRKT